MLNIRFDSDSEAHSKDHDPELKDSYMNQTSSQLNPKHKIFHPEARIKQKCLFRDRSPDYIPASSGGYQHWKTIASA